MLVRNLMIEGVTATQPNATLRHAVDLIESKRFDTLPVLEGNRLVGIISLSDILHVFRAAGAGAMEQTVASVMATNLITVAPSDPIERAAKLMATKDIPFLPVVDDGALKGVISASDILRTFGDVLGVDSGEARLAVLVPERAGALARITETVRALGLSIHSAATFHSQVLDQYEIVLRVSTTTPAELIERLESKGFKVIDVRS